MRSSSDVPGGTTVVCTKNLSFNCMSGGAVRCACMITVKSHVALGRITPVFGRTQYLLGEVVLTLKATYSSDLLTRWTEHELCFFSSKVNWSSRGRISTTPCPIATTPNRINRRRLASYAAAGPVAAGASASELRSIPQPRLDLSPEVGSGSGSGGGVVGWEELE